MGKVLLGLYAFDRTEAMPLYLRNYFFEVAPTNIEDQVSLISRPRQKMFASAGLGPMRGLYRKGGVLADQALSGAIIALSGTSLYRVPQTGVGASVYIGEVDGTLRMTAEGNSAAVVLCCGASLWRTDGTVLTQITLPPGLSASAVDYLSGRFLVCSDLGRFYWTPVGGLTINALDYATAESQPDVLLTLKVIGDELWLFGRLSIEVWQPTGDADLPYQRITGRIFGIGITGRETCQKLNYGGEDTVLWVGTDRRAYQTKPNPVRISDHGLEEKLARVTDPTALYAVIWNWEGHDFYVLHIPGEGSHSYDLTTEKWTEVSSFDAPYFRASVSAVGPNNQAFIGDDQSGVIWSMSDDVRADDYGPTVFESSGLLELTSTANRLNDLSMDLTTGLDPDPDEDPMMYMSMSDDKGMTWSIAEPAPMGRQGQRQDVIGWRRLGLMKRPGRLFRFRTTEPATLRKLKFNEPF